MRWRHPSLRGAALRMTAQRDSFKGVRVVLEPATGGLWLCLPSRFLSLSIASAPTSRKEPLARYRRLSPVSHPVSGESAPGFLTQLPLKATAYFTRFTHRNPRPTRVSCIKASAAAQMWTAFFKKNEKIFRRPARRYRLPFSTSIPHDLIYSSTHPRTTSVVLEFRHPFGPVLRPLIRLHDGAENRRRCSARKNQRAWRTPILPKLQIYV